MPSPYDLFEATREAVDAFMAEDLNRDIEAPHCHECDDWHWGPCLNSQDQPTEHKS